MTVAPEQASVSATRLASRSIAILAIAAVVFIGGSGLLIAQLVHTTRPAGAAIAPPGGDVAPPLGGDTGTTTTSTTVPHGNGTGTELGNGVVTVVAPAGWKTTAFNAGAAVRFSQASDEIVINVEEIPGGVASTVVGNLVTNWLSQDRGYSQVQTTVAATSLPTGATSAAGDVYTALYTSNGGSVNELGNAFAFTRADGWVIEMLLDADGLTPSGAHDAFVAAQPAFNTALSGAIQSFVKGS